MEVIQMGELIIETLSEDVRLPSYVSDGDSGMDVRSRDHCLLMPGQTFLFKLGFKMGIPEHPWHEAGWRWECQARPRSGVSLKTSLTIPNSPGTIDNFYTSEVGVIMRNGALPRVGDQKTVRTLDGRDVAIEDLPVFLRPKNNVVPVGTLWIKPGDRIAQLVLAPVIRPLKITAGKIAPTSLNSEFGFASSITTPYD